MGSNGASVDDERNDMLRERLPRQQRFGHPPDPLNPHILIPATLWLGEVISKLGTASAENRSRVMSTFVFTAVHGAANSKGTMYDGVRPRGTGVVQSEEAFDGQLVRPAPPVSVHYLTHQAADVVAAHRTSRSHSFGRQTRCSNCFARQAPHPVALLCTHCVWCERGFGDSIVPIVISPKDAKAMCKDLTTRASAERLPLDLRRMVSPNISLWSGPSSRLSRRSPRRMCTNGTLSPPSQRHLLGKRRQHPSSGHQRPPQLRHPSRARTPSPTAGVRTVVPRRVLEEVANGATSTTSPTVDQIGDIIAGRTPLLVLDAPIGPALGERDEEIRRELRHLRERGWARIPGGETNEGDPVRITRITVASGDRWCSIKAHAQNFGTLFLPRSRSPITHWKLEDTDDVRGARDGVRTARLARRCRKGRRSRCVETRKVEGRWHGGDDTGIYAEQQVGEERERPMSYRPRLARTEEGRRHGAMTASRSCARRTAVIRREIG